MKWIYIVEWSDGTACLPFVGAGWKSAAAFAARIFNRTDMVRISRHAPGQPFILARREFKRKGLRP